MVAATRGELGAFFVLLDEDGGRVRNFLLGDQQHLLANELGDQETLRLIGDLIFGKVSRTLRQGLDDRVKQLVQSFPLQRRNWNHFSKVVQLFVFGDQRQQVLLVQRVDLVQQQKGLLTAPLDDVEDKLIAGSRASRSRPR